jgi:hypothetical protein
MSLSINQNPCRFGNVYKAEPKRPHQSFNYSHPPEVLTPTNFYVTGREKKQLEQASVKGSDQEIHKLLTKFVAKAK